MVETNSAYGLARRCAGAVGDEQAIDKLQFADRTATGQAILTALQSIATIGAVIGGGNGPPPARIVLFSDGRNGAIEPDSPDGAYTAARTAKGQGVPISTISFGTPYGYVDINGQQIPVPVDDETMKKVAEISGGTAYNASTVTELKDVYATLQQQIGFEVHSCRCELGLAGSRNAAAGRGHARRAAHSSPVAGLSARAHLPGRTERATVTCHCTGADVAGYDHPRGLGSMAARAGEDAVYTGVGGGLLRGARTSSTPNHWLRQRDNGIPGCACPVWESCQHRRGAC